MYNIMSLLTQCQRQCIRYADIDKCSDVVVAIRGYTRKLSANVGLFQGLRRMLSALLKTLFSHHNLLSTVCGKLNKSCSNRLTMTLCSQCIGCSQPFIC